MEAGKLFDDAAVDPLWCVGCFGAGGLEMVVYLDPITGVTFPLLISSGQAKPSAPSPLLPNLPSHLSLRIYFFMELARRLRASALEALASATRLARI